MKIHQFPKEVLHIQIDLVHTEDGKPALTVKEQDETFEAIAAWCDAELLFIGGSLANNVVYAPLKSISAQKCGQLRHRVRHQLRHQLRGLILSQPGIAGCHMKWQLMSYLQSMSDKAACLEAFSQAQHYLAQRMADCADALTELVPQGPRSWRASVSPDGTLLELQHWPQQIWLALSLVISQQDGHQDARLEGQRIPELVRFDKQTIAISDLQPFIADWLDLHWSKVPEHPEADLSTGRWQAESKGWRVWITGNPSAQLNHREVMLRWMGVVVGA